MKYMIAIFLIWFNICCLSGEDANSILDKIDANLFSNSRIIDSRMVIEGRRGSREISTRSWSRGTKDSFTQYLAPPREAGTKMLKLDDKLWLYDKNSDRIIQISGHLLRQSVNGSDLSYEDFMDETMYRDNYEGNIIREESIEGTKCWVLELEALRSTATYRKRVMWVDKEHYLPLKEELFSESGTLLKRIEFFDIRKVKDRWYPFRIYYKDVLKTTGKGTNLIIDSIELDADIPDSRFSKSRLRK